MEKIRLLLAQQTHGFIQMLFGCVFFSLIGAIGTRVLWVLSSFKEQHVQQIITPQIAFIRQIRTEDKLSLRIVDHNKKIIREKIFDVEDENELLTTVIEWENELLDIIRENENTVSEIKAELLIELENKDNMDSLQQSIVPLLNDSNHKLAQATI